MTNHKKWESIQAYFKDIPISHFLQDIIDVKLAKGINLILMILKEENGSFTPEEKFKAICELYPEETKDGRIIISKVPDITSNVRLDV